MIYSKRGPLWADLVWRSALLHKCEILEDLHQRLVPEKGDRWETTSQYMRSHVTMWHSTIPSVVSAWFDTHSRMTSLFLAPLLLCPHPHWGVFLSLEIEGFWPSLTGPNGPPGCNGCCMQRHHSWTIPGRIRHTKRFFPRVLAREDIRCDVDENTGKIRLPFYLWVFLFEYSNNQLQLYCNYYCFFAFFFSL